jgi:uncharacterized protein (DUF1810 family)
MTDPYNLQRFVTAQAGTYAAALAEIRAGRKTSHWMWFIFPQIAGLGRSAMAQLYAISGADEARAYLDHPLLGERLRECTEALNALRVPDAEAIFGGTDAMKLKSSLTLFDAVSQPAGPFAMCLARYFGGARDAATLHLLG